MVEISGICPRCGWTMGHTCPRCGWPSKKDKRNSKEELAGNAADKSTTTAERKVI